MYDFYVHMYVIHNIYNHYSCITMAKRSALELFDNYYQALIFSLPMKDDNFTEELFKYNLFPGDVKCKLGELSEHKDRTSYFLDNVIKTRLLVGDNTCFMSLLTVMSNSKHDNVKDLARQLESEFDLNTECELHTVIL